MPEIRWATKYPSNSEQYCFWHHLWVWELPPGWKVNAVGGNVATATNTFTRGVTSVEVTSPAVLPTSNTAILNVCSEDAWPYPVNAETPIWIGPPQSLTGNIIGPTTVTSGSSVAFFMRFVTNGILSAFRGCNAICRVFRAGSYVDITVS